MDIQDIAPRAVERAGGEIICYGAPVDPGNLLLLARLDTVPILGAPGCARSPKTNIIDLVLPRLLAGEQLTQADIVHQFEVAGPVACIESYLVHLGPGSYPVGVAERTGSVIGPSGRNK